MVTCHGNNIYQQILLDEKAEHSSGSSNIKTTIIVVTLLSVLTAAGIGCYVVYQRAKLKKLTQRTDWLICLADITFDSSFPANGDVGQLDPKTLPQDAKSVNSKIMDRSPSLTASGLRKVTSRLHVTGTFNGKNIGLRIAPLHSRGFPISQISTTFIGMKDTIVNDNIMRFHGVTPIEHEWFAVNSICTKGSVTDVLMNKNLKLSNNVLCNMAKDIATGMACLHKNNIVHSCLRGSCCLVDSNWSVKVADWEFNHTYNTIETKKDKTKDGVSFLEFNKKSYESVQGLFAENIDFWTAPEIIRTHYDFPTSCATDMYSFAIVLQEIFSRQSPYYEHHGVIPDHDIIKSVVCNGLRPKILIGTPVHARQVMDLGWSADPSSRPSFDLALQLLKPKGAKGQQGNVLDAVIEALETYATELEIQVQ